MVKAGIKTTELAATILVGVGATAASIAGELSPKWAAVASAIAVGCYSIGRGLAKLGNGGSVPPA